jgi:hypothetical protein
MNELTLRKIVILSTMKISDQPIIVRIRTLSREIFKLRAPLERSQFYNLVRMIFIFDFLLRVLTNL